MRPKPRTTPTPRAALGDDALFALAKLGHQFYLDDRLDDARIVFEGLHSIAPKNAYVLRALGETCLLLGDHAAALRAANGAVTISGQEASTHLLRGRVLLAAGREDDARRDLSRAAKLGSSLAAALMDLDPRSVTRVEQLRERKPRRRGSDGTGDGTGRE